MQHELGKQAECTWYCVCLWRRVILAVVNVTAAADAATDDVDYLSRKRKVISDG